MFVVSSWLQGGLLREAGQTEGPGICKLYRNTEKGFIFTAVPGVATSYHLNSGLLLGVQGLLVQSAFKGEGFH